MSASDNTSVIDATRTMIRALEDNTDGLEAIWRGAATKDQIQDMINMLELAQVSASDKRHMQEAAQLAAETEARSAAAPAKTSFPPATPRGANKATTASSKRQATDIHTLGSRASSIARQELSSSPALCRPIRIAILLGSRQS